MMEISDNHENHLIEYLYALPEKESFRQLRLISNINTVPTEICRDHCGLIVLNVSIYKNSIIEVAERILHSHPDMLVVIIANDDRYALNAMQIGVLDYIVSPVLPGRLEKLEDKLKKRLHDSAFASVRI